MRTSLLRSSFAAPALMLAALAALSAPAAAQTAPTHPYVIHALGGVTFPGPGGGVFGAGAGVDIAAVPGLVVFGEFGKLTNVMTSDLQDIVDEAFNIDEAEPFDFEFDVDLPTTYGLAGARFNVATGGPLGVFVEGGLGFARVGLDVRLVVEGEDVSDLFSDFLDDEDILDPSTEALFVVGGGVRWPVTPRVDLTGGLRLNRVAAAGGITKTALYVGLLWRP